MSSVKSNHVIEIVDSSIDNDPPYFVMPLAVGSLEEKLTKYKGDEAGILSIMDQICFGEDVRYPPSAERRTLALCMLVMTRGRGIAPNARAANEWMREAATKGWVSEIPLAPLRGWVSGSPGGEEENLDRALTVILNASATEVTQQPAPPIGLRAFATANAGIRVEWAYNTINPPVVLIGLHVYIGTGGSPNYSSAAATISYAAAIAGTFVANVAGLTSGTNYTIGVRAYNTVTEEPNTITFSRKCT